MRSSAADRATEAARSGAARADADPARPGFHFRPPSGWMNDPNGALWLGDQGHLFYQHNPYEDRWGHVHWGHAVTDDLVRWRHRPVALAPSRELGEGHCFSGSALVRSDGTPMLFYTSVPTNADDRANEQWAVLCDRDMRAFRKAEANPVLALPERDGPDFRGDWRDPFVFERDGRAFLLLGAVLEDRGAPTVALYETEEPTLLRWRYRGLLRRGDPAEHTFFECPGLLHVGGEDLLVYSDHRPVEFLSGRFDPEPSRGKELFAPSGRGRLDHSLDFYALARVTDAPGEAPVVVGWVRGWSGGRGWNGALGLPRVVSRGPDGALRQTPVPAVASLRAGPGEGRRDVRLVEPARSPDRSGHDADTSASHLRLEGLSGPCLEVRAALLLDEVAVCGLRLVRAAGGRPVATVRCRRAPSRSEATLEIEGRSWHLDVGPGHPPETAGPSADRRVTSFPVELPADGRLDLRLFWDRSLLEVFALDGREVCTRVLAQRGEPVRVEAFVERGGARVLQMSGWKMEEIW